MAKVYFHENVDFLPIPWVEVGSKSEKHMWTRVGLYDRSGHRATDWRLHPLIHTSAPVNLAQSVVARSQEEKCIM